MAIRVTAPNGSTVDFPDGTDHATINGVMMQHFKADEKPAPDKYQQAALDERNAIFPKTRSLSDLVTGGQGTETSNNDAGFTRRLAHGATLGADTTIMAALETIPEMIKRGVNPKEAYNFAKAREDLIMQKSRENTGIAGTAVEALGGGVSAGGLANAGVTAARYLPQGAGLLARSGAGAADAAAIGGFSGAMEGNGLKERATNAATGAAVGGVLGGITPGVIAATKMLAAPVMSNIAARANPKAYAEAQFARVISENNLTPQEIELALQQAHTEGQGMFTVADALGNPGQRMLSTVARSPGEGRSAVVDALEARQAGQGRRVSNALAEGFDSPQTAAQTEARLTGARDTAADAAYGAVRKDANPVDVTRAIAHIDETLGPSADQMFATHGSASANDSVEAILLNFRNKLSRTNPDDFAAIQRIRGDMADAAQNAKQNGYGNRARLIGNATRELDAAMEDASAGHLAANRNFAQASRNIDAVDQGRTAAARGRTEDTIPAFQALPSEGQAAFRAGYVDPLIAQTQGAAVGVNKARPLTNDAFQAEAAAMAPGNSMMQRRLGREQTMFETRNQALGGSRTADNLNDDKAMSVAPEVIGVLKNIITGNFGGAVKTAVMAGQNALTGNTAAVRKEVADMLLQSGRKIPAGKMQDMVDNILRKALQATKIAEGIGRGAVGGAVVTGPGQKR